jgi:chromosome segregation ATPase
MEELEAEKRKKKEEMETLLGELDKAVKTVESTEPGTGKEVGREDEEKVQAIKEMQTVVQEKKEMIETALKEINEGTQAIKELEAKGLAKKENVAKIRAIQERMMERKGYLETAIKEMEGLREKYGKYR